jgi:hypothetical protein
VEIITPHDQNLQNIGCSLFKGAIKVLVCVKCNKVVLNWKAHWQHKHNQQLSPHFLQYLTEELDSAETVMASEYLKKNQGGFLPSVTGLAITTGFRCECNFISGKLSVLKKHSLSHNDKRSYSQISLQSLFKKQTDKVFFAVATKTELEQEVDQDWQILQKQLAQVISKSSSAENPRALTNAEYILGFTQILKDMKLEKQDCFDLQCITSTEDWNILKSHCKDYFELIETQIKKQPYNLRRNLMDHR